MRIDEYVYRCLTLYWSIHGAVGTLHTRLLLSNFQQMYMYIVVAARSLHSTSAASANAVKASHGNYFV